MTFFEILKIISEKTNDFEHFYLYFSCFDLKQYNKYEICKRFIFDNHIITSLTKQKILQIFFKAQKTYFALNRFFYIYKYKKTSLYDNTVDFYCNKLSNFPEEQKITLLHYNKKYIFRLTDLMNMWKKSLSNNDDLFPEPILLKNPYTNLFFKKHNLYNIYFKIHNSNMSIPLIINAFFQVSFNIEMFELKFNPSLKDMAIYNYIENGDRDDIIEDIQTMCRKYYKGKDNLNLKITYELFPSIFKKMRFFLILFYLSEYSFNLRLKRRCIKILHKDINHFILINKECAFNTCIFRKGTFMIPTSSLTKQIIRCSKHF